MRQFRAAMALTGAEFSEAVQYYAKVHLFIYLFIFCGCQACWPSAARAAVDPGRRAAPAALHPLLELSEVALLAHGRLHAPHMPSPRTPCPPPQSWLPARSHVKEALEQRTQIHPSGERSYLFPLHFGPLSAFGASAGCPL